MGSPAGFARQFVRSILCIPLAVAAREALHNVDCVTLSESCCSEWVPVPGFFRDSSQAQNDNVTCAEVPLGDENGRTVRWTRRFGLQLGNGWRTCHGSPGGFRR